MFNCKLLTQKRDSCIFRLGVGFSTQTNPIYEYNILVTQTFQKAIGCEKNQ